MEAEPLFDHKKKFIGFCAALGIDLICSSFLFYLDFDFNWNELLRPFSPTEFKRSYTDTLMLSIFRVILIPLFLTADVYSKRALVFSSSRKARNLPVDSVKYTLQKQKKKDSKEEKAPILARIQEHFFLTTLFALILMSQVYTGIKTISSNFETYEIPRAVLIGVLVICMNGQLFFARDLSKALSREKGKVFPNLHPHPLFFDKTAIGHLCGMETRRFTKPHFSLDFFFLFFTYPYLTTDLCRVRIRMAYRCRACDFDMCMDCFRKNNLSAAEGLIRNDAGIVEEKELSTWQYAKQALSFLKPYWILSVMALLFLVASSASSLLVPNYQGKILDDVVKSDSQTFMSDIEYFIGLNLLIGVLGGIRNLIFNIIGRRMAASIRERLYKSLLYQDIAFFDGMQTGDLTSRITNDVSVLVAPAQTVLTSVLSASIALVGGFYMCIYTSWRLSILAFTVIGPITMIYRMYAEWSKLVNREIWAALGDANSLATQALTNIRTVRAFSAEAIEFGNFHVATEETVRLSVKDSFVGAGAYALTNYLDMTIGVLILWYGGSVAMQDPDILSVGKLITFQLYWYLSKNKHKQSSIFSNVCIQQQNEPIFNQGI